MILICTDHRYAHAMVQARRRMLNTRGEPMGHSGSPWSDRQLQFAHLAAIRREDGLYEVLKCRHAIVGAPVSLDELRMLCDEALKAGDGTTGAPAPVTPAAPAGRRFDLDDGLAQPGPTAPAGENIENGIPPGPAPGHPMDGVQEIPAPAVRDEGDSAYEREQNARRRLREQRLLGRMGL